MPEFVVTTPQRTYSAVVERGAVLLAPEYLPRTPVKSSW